MTRDCGVSFDPAAMFDVQVKSIGENKRQLLNILHAIHLYDRIKRNDTRDWTPRNLLIGGKAAPGYAMAKLIIKLISNVAQVINTDEETDGLLRVAFIPDYRVSVMEIIVLGTDLSQQISTAGTEASGTSNMKAMLNGAITIGTFGGTNIEIIEEVGDENFFLFGLTAAQREAYRRSHDREQHELAVREDKDLKRVIELLESERFNRYEPSIFDPIIQAIRYPSDPWLTIADFPSYVDAQRRVAQAFKDKARWARMSILNTAYSGKFSIDRTAVQYNKEIWQQGPNRR